VHCRSLKKMKNSLKQQRNIAPWLKKSVAKNTAGRAPGAQDQLALVSLVAQKKYTEACTLADKLIQDYPLHGFGWKGMGFALKAQGKLDDALSRLQHAEKLSPEDVEIHNALGSIFQVLKRFPEAEASFRRAIQLDERYADAYYNLSSVLKERQCLREAESMLRHAIELRPDFAEAYHNLGSLLHALARLADAEAAFLHAIRLNPSVAETYNNLGSVFKDQGRLQEAEACFRQALGLQSNLVAAYTNMSTVLSDTGRLTEAERCLRQAKSLDPASEKVSNSLAIVLKEQGRLAEADASYRQAIHQAPGLLEMHSNLLLSSLYAHHASPEAIFNEHLAYGTKVAELAKGKVFQHSPPHRPLDRPLRIGFVSADLRRHAVTYFLAPLLAILKAEGLDLFAYYNYPLQDATTQLVRSYFSGWQDVAGSSDDELAAQIAADKIDILLDLSGHSAGNRLPVFARKPAPVQVTWLGHPATTGVPGMDWRITDVHAEPPGLTEHLNTEKLWRLPDIFCCYQPSPNSPEPLAGLPYDILSPAERVQGLPADLISYIDPVAPVVTLGCFNNFAKVTPPVIALWGTILSQLPQARLLLEINGGQDVQFSTEVRQRFVRAGAQPAQIHVLPRKPEHQYALYRQVDLALDPFPCVGGTTSCDSLWMGVPFVTLAGEWFVGRMGVTLLHNVGLDALIAHSEQEYVDKVVALVNDLPRLRALREGLRERVQASPIMDSARFGRQFAEALRGMWQYWTSSPAVVAQPITRLLSTAEKQHLLSLYHDQKWSEAEQAASLLLDPCAQDGWLWKVWGAALHALGRLEPALAAKKKAVQLLPDDAEAHRNLANAYLQLGDQAQAGALFRHALSLEPQHVQTSIALGNVLKDTGQLAEAEACYRQALSLQPSHAQTHYNLGSVLYMLKRFPEAGLAYMQAAKLKPDLYLAYGNLGMVFKDLGVLDQAIKYLQHALQLCPEYLDAKSNLLLASLYASNVAPTESFAAHQRCGQQIAAQAAHVPPESRARPVGQARPLRIGWVSADLRRHAVTYFLEPLLQQLRAQGFSLFAYANSHQQDEMTTRIRQHLEGWREVAGMSDAELVDQIVTDQIDILIDLSGHTAGNRLPVFACKPAPVQLTWLGYPATTGVPGMDWRITDVHAEPEGLTEHLNTEKLWRLPEIFCCYQPSPNSPEPLPGLPCETLSPAERVQGLPPELAQAIDPSAQVMTLGCFNNFAKVTPPVIALWSQILSRLPQARLLLEIHGGQDPQFATDVRQRFVRAGTRPEQIHIVPRKPEHQYALYRQLDLALDPFPCTGGTTSCDSLWMGVPFVTLAGEWFVGRMGVTLLHNAGLDELIAHSPAEYADKVVALVNDLPRLRAIRHGLRERVAASPIMDSERFGQHFAQALRGMWEKWCSSVLNGSLLPEENKKLLADLYNAGNFIETEEKAREAIISYPKDNFGWKVLGVVLQSRGKLEDALKTKKMAVELSPNDVDAISSLGHALCSLGFYNEAVITLKNAVEIDPDHFVARNNLGVALQKQGRDLQEAETHFLVAIEKNPKYAIAHDNLGVLLFTQNRILEAEVNLRHALELNPNLTEAHNNLGSLLQRRGQLSEAKISYSKALALNSSHAGTHINMGNLLKDVGLLLEAQVSYQQVLTLEPYNKEAKSNMLLAYIYSSATLPGASFSEHLHYGQYIAGRVAPLRRTHVPSLAPLNRPLRIGWVSADLRRHAVTYFLEPLLQQLRTQGFSLFAYANSHQQDEMTTRIRQHLEGWREVAGMSDAELVDQIVTDQIDILIDLSGHTAGNRLPVFACKPAPVQLTWLGYPATTGVPGMDWRITDVHAEPEGLTEHLNTEKLWRLPEIFCCYQPSPNSPEPLPGLPCETLSPAERVQGLPPELAQAVDPAAQVMTLGCFNNFAKVTPPVISLWSQILSRLPQARLLLEIHGGQDPQFTADVRQRFVQAGARPEQIHIVPRKPEHQYALYRQLDLALDPFPCTGGTTSCDSLWMGVPFVTLAGEWFVGRMGVTLLHNAGLDELIAHSTAEYADKVVALVNDLPRLRAIRHGLRERVAASPIMDSARFGQHFAQALRGMWAASGGQTSSASPL